MVDTGEGWKGVVHAGVGGCQHKVVGSGGGQRDAVHKQQVVVDAESDVRRAACLFACYLLIID
jgi:hypothetical protein